MIPDNCAPQPRTAKPVTCGVRLPTVGTEGVRAGDVPDAEVSFGASTAFAQTRDYDVGATDDTRMPRCPPAFLEPTPFLSPPPLEPAQAVQMEPAPPLPWPVQAVQVDVVEPAPPLLPLEQVKPLYLLVTAQPETRGSR